MHVITHLNTNQGIVRHKKANWEENVGSMENLTSNLLSPIRIRPTEQTPDLHEMWPPPICEFCEEVKPGMFLSKRSNTWNLQPVSLRPCSALRQSGL